MAIKIQITCLPEIFIKYAPNPVNAYNVNLLLPDIPECIQEEGFCTTPIQRA